MKARNTLITIGILLILFNILSYAGGISAPPENVNKTGYYIGRNIFFIAGIVLLIIAYNRHKRVVARKDKDMIDDFLN